MYCRTLRTLAPQGAPLTLSCESAHFAAREVHHG